VAELKSLVALYGFDFRKLIEPEYSRHGRSVPEFDHEINMESLENFPYVIMDWPRSLVKKIPEMLDRSILVKKVIELLGQGSTYEEVLGSVDREKFKQHEESLEKFAFVVGATGKKVS
jgi:hypothetical protein